MRFSIPVLLLHSVVRVALVQEVEQGDVKPVPVLIEVFKIYPIFPFKHFFSKVIHEFAMISSLGALLHVLSFVLVSGLKPERCAAFWVIKEEAAEI